MFYIYIHLKYYIIIFVLIQTSFIMSFVRCSFPKKNYLNLKSCSCEKLENFEKFKEIYFIFIEINMKILVEKLINISEIYENLFPV